MIEKIVLHNFQKYEDETVEFKDMFHLLSGTNGAGKSTILRAICWVALNNQDNKLIRRTYSENGTIKVSDETFVEVFVDGVSVKRVLSNSKNEYWVEGEKLTGFGRGVPAKVSDIFRMSDINVSSQFSPLFLLSNSGGDLSKELSELVSLEEMTALSDSVNKDIRDTSASLSKVNEALRDNSETLKLVSYYDAAYEDIKVVSDNAKVDLEQQVRLTELQKIVAKVQDTSYIAKIKLNFDSYFSTFVPLDFSDEDIFPIKSAVQRLEKLLFIDSLDLSCFNICIDFSEEDLSTVKDTIKKLEDNTIQKESFDKLLKEVTKELLEFKVCPLCGRLQEDVK